MSTFITILIGSIGGIIAWYIGAPAPFLTGPATLVTLCAVLVNVNCQINTLIRNMSFIIIGISTAEGINAKALDNILTWPISLIGMTLSIILLMFSIRYIFQSYFKMKRNDAILASTPGHLSYVLSLSEITSGSTVIISVIQSIRVLTLTLIVPGLITLFTDTEEIKTISSNLVLNYFHLTILIVSSSLLGFILLRFRTPAAFLIGGMISSIIGHGFELTPGTVPKHLTIFAFIILGSLIGSRFTGINFKIFKSCILRGGLFTILSLIISFVMSLIVSEFTEFQLVEILIAIAPGGLETMIVMGQLVGTDPAFVAFHHLARLFVLLIVLSIIIKK